MRKSLFGLMIVIAALTGCSTVQEIKDEVVTEVGTELNAIKEDVKAVAKEHVKAIVVAKVNNAKAEVESMVANKRQELQEKLGFKIHKVAKNECLSTLAYSQYRNQFLWPNILWNNPHVGILPDGTKDVNYLREGTFIYLKLDVSKLEINAAEQYAGYGRIR